MVMEMCWTSGNLPPDQRLVNFYPNTLCQLPQTAPSPSQAGGECMPNTIIGQQERANLVVRLARFFYIYIESVDSLCRDDTDALMA